MPMEDSFNPPPLIKNGVPIYNPTPEEWQLYWKQRERAIEEMRRENAHTYVNALISTLKSNFIFWR